MDGFFGLFFREGVHFASIDRTVEDKQGKVHAVGKTKAKALRFMIWLTEAHLCV